MEIKSLRGIDFASVYEAFDKAFEEYEVRLNADQLEAMLKRRGFNPGLSFAAFDGNKIMAFTLNGIGYYNGKLTAYDTGTGTLKEYRGKGLATEIFNYSIPYLKNKGVEQYLLEVLQHNTQAVSVYRKLGFEVVREFNYFIKENTEVAFDDVVLDSIYEVKELDIQGLIVNDEFWDTTPSWQNSLEAINRVKESFICLGVFVRSEMVGYCVFEPLSGDVTQLGVIKHHRRKSIGSILFKNLIKYNKNEYIKIVNTDVLSESITEFLKAGNIGVKGKQYEMIKPL